ncbi:hypothetical protein [Vibrio cyclitrophicus]|uniref:hypothetical protein n=1 Tax=Vibrio cyclitrophicus TaxID=47951 RepID=UPI000AE8EB92|nr:hypothetical protein [Vibrio cyclitrophicus]
MAELLANRTFDFISFPRASLKLSVFTILVITPYSPREIGFCSNSYVSAIALAFCFENPYISPIRVNIASQSAHQLSFVGLVFLWRLFASIV